MWTTCPKTLHDGKTAGVELVNQWLCRWNNPTDITIFDDWRRLEFTDFLQRWATFVVNNALYKYSSMLACVSELPTLSADKPYIFRESVTKPHYRTKTRNSHTIRHNPKKIPNPPYPMTQSFRDLFGAMLVDNFNELFFWNVTCLVGVHGVNWIGDNSRLVHKCVHTADETGQSCSVSNILRTTENSATVANPVHTADADEMRQSCLVCVNEALVLIVSWFSTVLTSHLIHNR